MGRITPKIAPSHWGSGLLSNTWFLRPTRDSIPNGISISSAVFAVFTNMTNRRTHTHTDRPRYSAYDNRPHLAVAVMRPKINKKELKMKLIIREYPDREDSPERNNIYTVHTMSAGTTICQLQSALFGYTVRFASFGETRMPSV